MSPKKHLLNMRTAHAKKLLDESTKGVSKVAEESGFSGVYHFCRAFREAVGKTPTEYRSDQKARAISIKWQM